MFEGGKKLLGLTVHRAGVHASLQDLGRFGYARHGLSQGGVMDLHSYCWANRLLENNPGCPALEIVIGMAAFRAESDLSLAITGADMQVKLDGVPVGNWRTFIMKRGQTLTVQAARTGMRTYLAVKGGFQAEPTLGSVSTVVRNGLGRVLREGDLLPAGNSDSLAAVHVPPRYVPADQETIELRVIESYQVADFSSSALERFYQSEYLVTQDADRMGVRLQGPAISSPPGSLISEGIALGAIQIPADGQPIILLNDRQTLGGYAKMGCIARVDLAKLAQARPGTAVRFVAVSMEQAQRDWREFCLYFDL